MKMLIVTHGEDLSCSRKMEEAGKRGMETRRILYSELGSVNKEDYDFCILRYPRGFEEEFQDHLKEFLSVFRENQLLDFRTYNKHPNFEDKLFHHRRYERMQDCGLSLQ